MSDEQFAVLVKMLEDKLATLEKSLRQSVEKELISIQESAVTLKNYVEQLTSPQRSPSPPN